MKKVFLILGAVLTAGCADRYEAASTTIAKACDDMTMDYFKNWKENKEYKSQYVEALERDGICYELIDGYTLSVFVKDAENNPYVFIDFTETGEVGYWQFTNAG